MGAWSSPYLWSWLLLHPDVSKTSLLFNVQDFAVYLRLIMNYIDIGLWTMYVIGLLSCASTKAKYEFIENFVVTYYRSLPAFMCRTNFCYWCRSFLLFAQNAYPHRLVVSGKRQCSSLCLSKHFYLFYSWTWGWIYRLCCDQVVPRSRAISGRYPIWTCSGCVGHRVCGCRTHLWTGFVAW